MTRYFALAVAAFLALLAVPAAAQSLPTLKSGNISINDYPAAMLRAGHGGTVVMLLTIDREGRVANCSIKRSSGYDDIDAHSCDVWSRRVRYNPARNAAGEPIVGIVTSAMRWEPPQ